MKINSQIVQTISLKVIILFLFLASVNEVKAWCGPQESADSYQTGIDAMRQSWQDAYSDMVNNASSRTPEENQAISDSLNWLDASIQAGEAYLAQYDGPCLVVEPSQTEPSQTEPSQTEPSQTEPSQE